MKRNFVFEWILAVHRAFWFPFFYAMGLEREPVEVYPMNSWIPAARRVRARPSRSVAAARSGGARKKAA
jgi:hypothetical protein